jgi:hypothetical protein
VQDALKSLPWVDPNTVKGDAKTRLVKFTVKDKKKFNLDEIKAALAAKDEKYSDVKLISGPG